MLNEEVATVKYCARKHPAIIPIGRIKRRTHGLANTSVNNSSGMYIYVELPLRMNVLIVGILT